VIYLDGLGEITLRVQNRQPSDVGTSDTPASQPASQPAKPEVTLDDWERVLKEQEEAEQDSGGASSQPVGGSSQPV
jgi:hypothetical protein